MTREEYEIKFRDSEQWEEMKSLAFFDFLKQDETDGVEWLPVLVWSSDYSRATFSALVQMDPGSIDRVLSTHEWNVRPSFSRATLANVTANSWQFHDGMMAEVGEMRFRALYHRLDYHQYRPSNWRLSDQFVLFYQLFFDEIDSIWKRIDEDGQVHQVARDLSSGTERRIEIQSRFLKDYLAATNTALVRFHDWRRMSRIEAPSNLDEMARLEVLDENKRFHIWVDKGGDVDASMWSRLLGKDLLMGFSEPAISLPEHSCDHRRGKYEEFIIGEIDGKETSFTCNEDFLANYFDTNRGNPHYLTPVFFRRGVLQKYISEPSRYTVSRGNLSCLSLWSLRFDDQELEVINAWLGDLGRLPYAEQKHWRGFNILPRGSVSEHWAQTQLFSQWVEPTGNAVYEFERAYEQLQSLWSAAFGSALFRKLSALEQHLDVINLPVNDELPEIDRFLQSLSKRLCDSIDVQVLKQMDPKGNDSGKDAGSLKRLRSALQAKGFAEKGIDVFVKPLETLQSLRSSGSAHRRGQGWSNQLTRFGLNNLSNQMIAQELLKRLTEGFSKMSQQLDSP